MIPVWSSALKDNEVNVTDLPMPRILGEGEEEPILVWALPSNGVVYSKNLPKRHPGGTWIASYTSKQAAETNPLSKRRIAYRTTLDERIASAKSQGRDGVVLISESYTVIETWRA